MKSPWCQNSYLWIHLWIHVIKFIIMKSYLNLYNEFMCKFSAIKNIVKSWLNSLMKSWLKSLILNKFGFSFNLFQWWKMFYSSEVIIAPSLQLAQCQLCRQCCHWCRDLLGLLVSSKGNYRNFQVERLSKWSTSRTISRQSKGRW